MVFGPPAPESTTCSTASKLNIVWLLARLEVKGKKLAPQVHETTNPMEPSPVAALAPPAMIGL